MHTLVRRYIKTGIAFLVVGLLIGLWSLAQRELGNAWPSPYQVSAHTHAILVGFVMMMIMGVALWLFPRPDRDDTRYDPRVAGAAYWCMTLGTAVRLAGELARLGGASPALRGAIVAAGGAQTVGIALFFYTMWSRVRAVGSAVREARGERF